MSTIAPPSEKQAETLVTLVIPVYNEQENIAPLLVEIIQAMDRQPRPWQVLFIDDGSTDDSLRVIRDKAQEDERVRYLAFAANRGQSAAFAAGFRESEGTVFVTLDADMQNDPADIPAMLNLYDQGFDMAIGWRKNRQDTRIKRIASRIANAVRNALSGETVRDTGCSLKVLRADYARNIPMFTGMHRFLPTLMKMQGARVAEMAVSHRPRHKGVSKYGIWDRAFSALYDLFAVCWMKKRHFTYTIRERK